MSVDRQVEFNPIINKTEAPKIVIAGQADTFNSEKHPDWNEDAFFLNKRCLAVFDGVGGVDGGKIASNNAKNYLETIIEKIPINLTNKKASFLMTNMLKDMNKQIRTGATTATIGIIYYDETKIPRVVIGHVGDSRLYINREGKIHKVTKDDSPKIPQQVQEIFDTADPYKPLHPKLKVFFNERNVIGQSLGKEFKKPYVNIYQIKPEDRIIATSDGIHDNLVNQEIQKIVCTSKNPAQDLVQLAIKRSHEKDISYRAKKDDMTAVVLKVSKAP